MAIELLAVEMFLSTSSDSESVQKGREPSGLSAAEELVKRRKQSHNQSAYVGSRFTLPTTNIAERLISRAVYSLSQRRKSINPNMSEIQMFLHMNFTMWNIADVHAVME